MARERARPVGPVDRGRVAARRRRLVNGVPEDADFLLARVAEETAERLAVVSRRFDLAVDLSGPGEAGARMLAAAPNVERVVRADSLVASPRGGPGARVVVDEEALPFRDGSVDLVSSLMALHLVNDLPGALVQIRRALRPDGLFLAAMPAGETIHELRASLIAADLALTGGARARVVPFAPLQTLAGLLQRAGFALPVADVDRVVVRYRSLASLIGDLAATGQRGLVADPDPRPARRALFALAEAHYVERFADPDGRLRATFEIAHLSGWAPHESQQKPLAPGSAKARLADALGTVERPAGERAGPGGPKG